MINIIKRVKPWEAGYNLDMPAFLIYGGNKETREKRFLEVSGLESFRELADVRVVRKPQDKNSIGIDTVREVISFTTEKPFNLSKKVCVFIDAHFLTIQAQNALLKTLEEPPKHCDIFLLAKTQNSLLETVVSRCRKIEVKPFEGFNPKGDPSLSFGWAQELAKEDKETVVKKLEELVESKRDKGEYSGIEEILRVMEDIESTNMNVRLALETLVVNTMQEGVINGLSPF